MQRLAGLLRSPFSFLFARPSTEERVAAYVIREHGRGRGLSEILEDGTYRTVLARNNGCACSTAPS